MRRGPIASASARASACAQTGARGQSRGGRDHQEPRYEPQQWIAQPVDLVGPGGQEQALALESHAPEHRAPSTTA